MLGKRAQEEVAIFAGTIIAILVVVFLIVAYFMLKFVKNPSPLFSPGAESTGFSHYLLLLVLIACVIFFLLNMIKKRRRITKKSQK